MWFVRWQWHGAIMFHSLRVTGCNFTSNLEEPAVMVNYFLQGDPYQGMVHFTRFFLNSILGMGGFIDVAGMANPKLQREQPHRFGSTLGHYGVGYGPYVHCRSTAASCVMMAAIWSIRCIRCCRG
jgi:ABC-type transporter lipoprotein component MlaA